MQEREESSPDSCGGEAEGRGERRVTEADVGKRVTFFSSQDKREKFGTLRFYGRTEFADGVWCGVELDRSEGKNNGSRQGIRYFICEPGYGVFVPAGKVEKDDSRRPRSRPNSRPGSRPSSAERSGRMARVDSGGSLARGGGGGGVKSSAVQQELARLTQTPVTDRPRRKAGQSSVTKWGQPLKAFPQKSSRSKDDGSLGSKRGKLAAPAPFPSFSSSLHKAASTENLRGGRGGKQTPGRPVKKSSSEQNISEDKSNKKAGSKRASRPNSVSGSSDVQSSGTKRWPRASSPKQGAQRAAATEIHQDRDTGAEGQEMDSPDGATLSRSSLSSSSTSSCDSRNSSPEEGPASTVNNGFIQSPTDMPPSVSMALPTGLATHASQLLESERLSVGGGVCRVPSPERGQSVRQSFQNSVATGAATLPHPLTHTAGGPEEAAVPQPPSSSSSSSTFLPPGLAQLLQQVMDQNRQLQHRQTVLEEKVESVTNQLITEMKAGMEALQRQVEQAHKTHQIEFQQLQSAHHSEVQRLTAQHQQDLTLLANTHNHSMDDPAKLKNKHTII